MTESITLNELGETLDDLSYPAHKSEVRAEFGDLELQLADGETTVGETLSWIETERFDSESELQDELIGALPRKAVGEPFQSEGEG
ncbi:hypothetical protein [Halovivax sp.]|uniref:DUF5789 family protein n=1 Tax=Halovivax sp. TaxID=1935978 RepID=UPI0025C4A040|nr:hypothetical protein [Halovivax sp.]